MRPSLHNTMMETALIWSKRATCSIRSVGCVLADKNNRVIGIGYNGVARGVDHCTEGFQCRGIGLPSGQDFCEAVHAEQNAIISCRGEIDTCYVTLSPCRSCIKLLLNTSCRRIVFLEEWHDEFAKKLWTSHGREWNSLSSLI